jgi:hypothetical protein
MVSLSKAEKVYYFTLLKSRDESLPCTSLRLVEQLLRHSDVLTIRFGPDPRHFELKLLLLCVFVYKINTRMTREQQRSKSRLDIHACRLHDRFTRGHFGQLELLELRFRELTTFADCCAVVALERAPSESEQ